MTVPCERAEIFLHRQAVEWYNFTEKSSLTVIREKVDSNRANKTAFRFSMENLNEFCSYWKLNNTETMQLL